MPRNEMSIDAEEITEKDKRAHPCPNHTPKQKERKQKISNEDPYVPHVYVKKRTAEY
jgi:hypothetical protein